MAWKDTFDQGTFKETFKDGTRGVSRCMAVHSAQGAS